MNVEEYSWNSDKCRQDSHNRLVFFLRVGVAAMKWYDSYVLPLLLLCVVLAVLSLPGNPLHPPDVANPEGESHHR
jgi:hypothetical protein